MAVFLPLLVLAFFSWQGTRAQVRAAWTSARDELKRSSAQATEKFAERLESALMPARIFPDPPKPGTGSKADEVLDGKDIVALRQLRDDPYAGLSPAGLPRRVIAGLRVMEFGGDGNDAAQLVSLALAEDASILSHLVVEKYAGDEMKKWWQQEELARQAFDEHPDVGEAGKWGLTPQIVWLRVDESVLRFLSKEAFEEECERQRGLLPPWAGVRVVADGQVFGDERGEVIATLPLAFGRDARVEFSVIHPEMIDADARRQGRWALLLLGAAVIVCAVALAMMHSAIRRERHLSEMKSQFVASVSHELRAPVASIRLMAEGLEAGKVESAMVREFHRLIARESARLSTLVTNVLDHSRLEQGIKEWQMRECDLREMIEESILVMEPIAREKGVSILVALDPVRATVDKAAMQQVMVNLLDNAIKFSPRRTQVKVELRMSHGEVEIAVSDEGPGVAKQERELIFERFYRSGNELRRETQGTGIGLSLVKSIVEKHGGSVAVSSRAEGVGSVFLVKIPCIS